MAKDKGIEQKQTMLIVVEGPSDEVFFKKIRSEIKIHNNLKITVRNAKGISRVVKKAQEQQFTGFDCRIGIIDNKDISNEEKQGMLKEAKVHRIEILAHEICLEATLLRIFPTRNKVSGDTCDNYKEEFQQEYLKGRREVEHYRRFFQDKINKTLLKKYRRKIEIIDKIMLYIEKGCEA